MAQLSDLVRAAAESFEALTGRRVEAVSAACRQEEGWRLTVEAVELERLPASTSLLASYEVLVDPDGDICEYRRTRRYYRNRVDEEVG
jgi:hypothetical protein